MRKGVNTSIKGSRVFVGLSGGVDSAVTAAILKEAGAEVTAVFIKGWYPPGMPCSWGDDRRDAMRVAAHLRLPFITLDASEEYRRGVIDYLLREYKAGRTPNPDIMCNREVKFGAFYTYAKEHGADYIATGHYAQADSGKLIRGIDPDKDQSYFLWAIPKEALLHTLFPLGGMHKSQVRELAKKFGLPNAQKKDSQGICFLGNVSVEDFLAEEFGTEPGEAIDMNGNIVGTHQGVLLSTVGQRVPLEGTNPGPWYVISKDVPTNKLTVSHKRSTLVHREMTLLEANWFAGPVPGTEYSAQYRYHGPKVQGVFANSAFIPHKPLPDVVAAGQSLVIYDGEECLGGGIIA